MRLRGWNDPDPAEIHHPTTDAEWDAALSRYLGSLNDAPLRRCVEVARSLGATPLVVETRYLDIDYRSEFSAYYARQFADVPDSAHRLHFFRKRLDSQALAQLPDEHDYIGYVVVRPALTGLVSRALLPPPPDLAAAVRTSMAERVNFFGQELQVLGVPFAQQDAQLGACAQAAARHGERRPISQSRCQLAPGQGCTTSSAISLVHDCLGNQLTLCPRTFQPVHSRLRSEHGITASSPLHAGT